MHRGVIFSHLNNYNLIKDYYFTWWLAKSTNKLISFVIPLWHCGFTFISVHVLHWLHETCYHSMALLATTASVLIPGVINVTLSISEEWLTSVWGILTFTLAPKQQWYRLNLISRGCRQPELHSVTSIILMRGTLLLLIFILPVMVLRKSGNFYLYRK